MPNFKFVARRQDGSKESGRIYADNEAIAIGELRKKNLTIISVTQEKEKAGFKLSAVESLFVSVPATELSAFTRQFSTMISAGIPVMECLDVLRESASSKYFKKIISQIMEDVKGGSDLSKAMSKHPRVFSEIYVNLIKAGEASGQLDVILERLANYQEATLALKREVVSALTYPIISLIVVIGIFFGLMLGIMPKFVEMFKKLNVPLPTITQINIAISVYMKKNIVGILIVMFGSIVAFFLYINTKFGRKQWDYVKLFIPIFGMLFKKVALSRFSRTFATLIKSGVPIMQALETVATTTGNKVVEEAIMNARENVRRGESLAKPLAEYKVVFPPMVVRMISIGEKSGAIESLLEKLADFYDQEVKATLKTLTSLLEPLLLVVMGALVGTVVISIFLPILRVQEALRKK